MKTIKDYAVQVYWDERAKYYVAEIPDIPTCAADGATHAEAMANLAATFAVLKEAYLEEEMTLPAPNPNLPISVAGLSAISGIVKMSRLADLAGIPVQSLATKLKRRTQLSTAESRRLAGVLQDYGFGGGLASVSLVGAVNPEQPRTMAALSKKKPRRVLARA